MISKAWQCRAIDMRLWATKVKDPYTQIEMMALADLYDRRAEPRRPVLPPLSRREAARRVPSSSRLLHASII